MTTIVHWTENGAKLTKGEGKVSEQIFLTNDELEALYGALMAKYGHSETRGKDDTQNGSPE